MNHRSRQTYRRCGAFWPLLQTVGRGVLVHVLVSEHRSDRSHSGTLWHSLRLLAVFIVLLTQTIASPAQKPVRRVLIVNDFGSVSSPGIAAIDQAIATGLGMTPYQIELYNENIESTLFPDDAAQRRIRDWYREKT